MRRQETQDERIARKRAGRAAEEAEARVKLAQRRRDRIIEAFASYIERKEAEFEGYDVESIDLKRL